MFAMFMASGHADPTDPLEGIFEMDQAKAVQKAGCKVVYIAIDLRSPRHWRRWGLHREVKDSLEIYFMSLPGLPVGWLLRTLGRYSARRLYRRVLRDHGRPDLVHAHFLGAAKTAAWLCRREALPLVVTEHSSKVNSPELSEGVRAGMRYAYGSAKVLLAVSSALKRNIALNTGMEARVVPNIVDMSIFHPGHEEHEGFRFVFAGNLIPSKNPAGLIRAFAKLSGSPCLTVFGDGPERQRLEALCRELNIQARVVFRGRCTRKELAEEYARSDCFVLPSESETFGVAYIEAMASGLPVIATRCGGPEGFVNDDNGLLIPTAEDSALQNAMEYMLLHAGEYDGDAISASAVKAYAPETIAGMLMKVYEEVIA